MNIDPGKLNEILNTSENPTRVKLLVLSIEVNQAAERCAKHLMALDDSAKLEHIEQHPPIGPMALKEIERLERVLDVAVAFQEVSRAEKELDRQRALYNKIAGFTRKGEGL